MEAEVLYLQSDGKHAASGDLKTVAGMLNGYYDFNREGAWQPFVGAGIGVAQVRVNGGPSDGDDTASPTSSRPASRTPSTIA